MSSENNYFNDVIINNILHLCKKYKNNIAGIINQNINKFSIIYPMLSIIPGINCIENKDDKGQKYRNISELKYKPDMYVIGRNIYNSENPEKTIDDILYKIKSVSNERIDK